MASFSFRAGNARKIARLPLYALGRLVTAVVPRGERWVFGCGAGIGDGPLEVWRVAREHGRDAVWLTDDAAEQAEARRLGIPTRTKSSLAGFWATARAGAIVVAYGLGDVNPYALSGRVVIAQLWHGIPLKRIGLDAPETLRSPIPFATDLVSRALGILYRMSNRRIDVLPAASHLVRARLETAFGVPDDRIVVTGEPRVDVLSRGTAEERRRDARGLLQRLIPDLPDSSALVLYAPTWRDGDADPAVPSDDDWRAIEEVLRRRDAVLLVRSHRLGAGEYAPPADVTRVRELGADVLGDITPALPGLDALVTDYSSLAYDTALVPLPVLYLAPDVAEYSRRRGFYGAYRDIAGDDAASTWGELVPQLDALLGDPEVVALRTERARRVSERVHAFRDGRAAQRVYAVISARVSAPSRRKASR